VANRSGPATAEAVAATLSTAAASGRSQRQSLFLQERPASARLGVGKDQSPAAS